VKFDVYYLESSLYTDGKVDAVVKTWTANGKTYEKEGALWLRTVEIAGCPRFASAFWTPTWVGEFRTAQEDRSVDSHVSQGRNVGHPALRTPGCRPPYYNGLPLQFLWATRITRPKSTQSSEVL